MPAVQPSRQVMLTALITGGFVGSGCDVVFLKAPNHQLEALRSSGKFQ
jgi:hypothetical protein